MKKSLKNQKALWRNQKAIATHLSLATLKDLITLISFSEDDSENEVGGEAHLCEEELGDEGDEVDVDDEEEDDKEGGEESEEEEELDG